MFKEYFRYQLSSFLVKYLYQNNHIKNYEIVKYLNVSLIYLRNSVNIKKINENEILKR